MFGTLFQEARRNCAPRCTIESGARTANESALTPPLRWLLVVILLAQLPATPDMVSAETALRSEFTYQGQLLSGKEPVDENCDMQFSLYDDETDGARIGDTVLAKAVSVQDGRFTVVLDFGSGAFEGSARWLEIAVRCPSGLGSYTTLSPRQALTAVPYALAGRMGAKTLTLGPTAFSSPLGGNPSRYLGGWLTPASRESSHTTWVTNVNLPDGATVRRVRCYWLDEETFPLDLNAGLMQLTMRRRRPLVFPADWQTMAEAEIDTIGWTQTVPWTLLDDEIDFAVIETDKYLYELLFSFRLHPGNTSEGFVHFGGCEVEYRTTGLP